MKVAIIGPPGPEGETLSSMVREELPGYGLFRSDLDNLRREGLPEDTAAAFVLTEDMHGLFTLRALTGLYPVLPVAVVSASPDFAMEAIRQGVRDYLIFPVLQGDLDRAARRLGLYVGKEWGNDHFDTG